MENKLIQITPTVFGVIVDDDAYDFEFIHNKTRIGYKVDYRLFKIDLPKGEYKIHGTCTLPNYDFDFEVDESWVKNTEEKLTWKKFYNYNTKMYSLELKEESFRTRIQKALNDLGLYAVNPYGEKAPKAVCLIGGMELMVRDSMTANVNRKRFEQWQSAESKTVKKILIIEKINQ